MLDGSLTSNGVAGVFNKKLSKSSAFLKPTRDSQLKTRNCQPNSLLCSSRLRAR